MSTRTGSLGIESLAKVNLTAARYVVPPATGVCDQRSQETNAVDVALSLLRATPRLDRLAYHLRTGYALVPSDRINACGQSLRQP
ncbi:MAG TPA: hypothetical protein VGY54_22390 [Polyangiaceae bacterium]|nr:hypothetical protein [Polyangiaceae bacterium]